MSADIQDITTTKVLDDIGSDHRPTKIEILNGDSSETKRKTFWNFRRANWKGFADCLDNAMGQVDTKNGQIDEVATSIEAMTQEAARKNIPRGSYKKFKPFWTKELEDTVKERRKARKLLEKMPLRLTRQTITD